MFSFIKEIFNFLINIVVRTPIINKGLFYILSSLRKIAQKEDSSFALEISVFMIVLL